MYWCYWLVDVIWILFFLGLILWMLFLIWECEGFLIISIFSVIVYIFLVWFVFILLVVILVVLLGWGCDRIVVSEG